MNSRNWKLWVVAYVVFVLPWVYVVMLPLALKGMQ